MTAERDIDRLLPTSREPLPTRLDVEATCAIAYQNQRAATLDIIDAGRTEATVDALIDDLLGRAQVGIDESPLKSHWHCRRGCGFCCYARVEIHPLEALAVARYLQQSKTAEELAAIIERLRERVRVLRPMTVEQWKHAVLACAL